MNKLNKRLTILAKTLLAAVAWYFVISYSGALFYYFPALFFWLMAVSYALSIFVSGNKIKNIFYSFLPGLSTLALLLAPPEDFLIDYIIISLACFYVGVISRLIYLFVIYKIKTNATS